MPFLAREADRSAGIRVAVRVRIRVRVGGGLRVFYSSFLTCAGGSMRLWQG